MNDLSGERFGRLTVIKQVPAPDNVADKRKIYYLCRCDCGTEKAIYYYDLTSGKTKSCKCLSSEKTAERSRARGFSKEKRRLKIIWYGMNARCRDKRLVGYKNYGGRGIFVCDEWKDFEKFYNWAINNGYKESLTLDRINNELGYKPSNCRFCTVKEQQNHRRDNRLITLNGVTLTISQWADKNRIGPATLKWRLDHGWNESELFIVPNLNNRWRKYYA